MEYFVIYDLKDNIIGYFNDIEELADYTKLSKTYLKHKFKADRDFIYYIFENSYRKIYRFT